MNEAIYTEGLSKTFPDKRAVDGLNWTVPEGSIVGLLGPNGAGKTTTLKMIMGMTHPESGTAKILGLDAVSDSVELRKICAFVPEDKLLYDSMEVAEFIRFYSSFFSEWSSKAESEFLGAWKVPRFERIKDLSKGMRARLFISVALSRKPRMLILDEPTEGLDPESIEDILGLIARWSASGDRTAVIATHRLDEVERICDLVSMMNSGKLILSGNLDDLRSEWKQIEVSGDISAAKAEEWEGVRNLRREGWSTIVTVSSKVQSVLERLSRCPGVTWNVRDMNLREIYLACMNQKGGMDYGVLEDLA